MMHLFGITVFQPLMGIMQTPGPVFLEQADHFPEQLLIESHPAERRLLVEDGIHRILHRRRKGRLPSVAADILTTLQPECRVFKGTQKRTYYQPQLTVAKEFSCCRPASNPTRSDYGLWSSGAQGA